MEVEVQEMSTHVASDEKGNVQEVSDKRVGPPKKFDFGSPDDVVTAVVGGGYILNWNGDFLQKKFAEKGVCARLYFDRKIAVDIIDPECKLARKKKALLFENGFGYLAIPPGCPTSLEQLKPLYKAALDEYYAYEAVHPRPAQVQSALIIGEGGEVKRAHMTAADIKVGGGVLHSVDTQAAEFAEAQRSSKKLTKPQREELKLHSEALEKIKKCAKKGIPFRNPFVGPGKRRYPIDNAVESHPQ